MKSRALLVLLLPTFLAAATEPVSGPSDLVIRSAAAKAVNILEKTNKVWWEKQSCGSCHHQTMPIIAFHMAAERNVPVDPQVAAMTTQKTFGFGARGGFDSAVQGSHLIDPTFGEAMFLFSASEIGIPRNFALSAYARSLAGLQRENGSWLSWDARPPQMYGEFPATALSMRALKLYASPKAQADTDARVARAANWLKMAKPLNTEDVIYKLFGLVWADVDEPAKQAAMENLLAMQRNDGGWAQDRGYLSDAYTTGEALYALNSAGVPASSPAFRKGLKFLTSTQAADGSWLVRSRMVGPAPLSPPYFESGFPYGKDQFISTTATGWAAMALMLAIDKVPQASKPAPPADPAVPAWVETVMFGSVEDLKAALDAGLDPNQQTANGSTVLMLAVPDAAKARLLLERGARPDARAKSGYNALLVASRFRGSAEAIRLLLDRGAIVNTPKGKPAAFGANPVFWTAYSGDLEATKLLLDSGARLEGAVSLGGLLPPWTALQIAAMQGDAAMVDLLASRGADVNAGDSFGVTPLSRAVLRNSMPTAKVLLARGAKVNYVDALGMTPLLYAATRDFGSSDMIRFLKAAKADSQIKTKEGKTPAALARQFGHERLAEAIGQ